MALPLANGSLVRRDKCIPAFAPELQKVSALCTLAPHFYGHLSGMPTRSAYGHIVQARKLRHRGEECRTLARLMDTEENAARYLCMADDYDALAEQEEQLARDVVMFDLKR